MMPVTKYTISTFEDFIRDMHRLDVEAFRKENKIEERNRKTLSELTTALDDLEKNMKGIRKHKWRHPILFVKSFIQEWKAKYHMRRVLARINPTIRELSDKEVRKMKKDVFWQERYQRYVEFIENQNKQGLEGTDQST